MGLIFICVAVMMVTCQQLTNGDTSQQQLTLSAASSVFSQNLYQKVAVNKTEIVYSPYSIHSVLTMTYMGARGTTASEMAQVLGLNTVPSPHQAYHDLILDWNAEQLVKVLTCNAIFINPYEMILPSFIQQTNDLYLATADNLDLQEPEKVINVLVANKTNNVIPEMLKPGTLDASTVLVLVNVLFFNGTWSSPFQKSLTQKQDFHQLGGATTQIDMMNDVDKIKRIKRDDSNDVDVVELPFLGDRFSLYIALPRKVEGITELEAHITSSPANVQQMFEGLQSENFHLGMPKFKIETSLELNDVLSSLGMSTAFGPTADFSGINGSGGTGSQTLESSGRPSSALLHGNPHSYSGLYIDKVIHKAVIDVQETGTVAAAATVVSISKGFISTISAPVVADHPFVFFLRDNVNQQILFQGKFSG